MSTTITRSAPRRRPSRRGSGLPTGASSAATLPPERHRRIHLGLLHADSDGYVEIAAGRRPPGAKLRITTRKDPGHFLAGGARGGEGWMDAPLALVARHVARGEEVFVAPAVRHDARRRQGARQPHALAVDRRRRVRRPAGGQAAAAASRRSSSSSPPAPAAGPTTLPGPRCRATTPTRRRTSGRPTPRLRGARWPNALDVARRRLQLPARSTRLAGATDGRARWAPDRRRHV